MILRACSAALAAVLAMVATTALAQDGGATAAVSGGQYALSAALQGGRHVAWRLKSGEGSVSVCSLNSSKDIICSLWSEAVTAKGGHFAINAEFSQLSGSAWVWLIDIKSGDTFLCQISLRSLQSDRPDCQTKSNE